MIRRGARFRPRVRRVVAPVLVLSGLAAIGAVIALPELPAWLSWAPAWALAAMGAALSMVGTLWFQPWAARRQEEADRERVAVDQLRCHLGRQEVLPQVGDPAASAFALRVHPAIPLGQRPDVTRRGDRRWFSPWRWKTTRSEGLDPDLPLFVDRDVGPHVRQWMRHAAQTGGFLLLIGDSSVGKTRLLYEAALAELADFSVLAPDLGNGDLVNKLAEATLTLPKLIVWLDELQRFLDGPYLAPGSIPITAATVRRLLDAPTPVVLLGTLWPEHAAQLHATGTDARTGNRAPHRPATVDILDDRRLREIAVRTFSQEERQATARLAVRDPRLAHALSDPKLGVTEVLTGAAELARWYERATTAQKSVVHAAVDARRLGIQAPLTADLLHAAARGYLTQSHSNDEWFSSALDQLSVQHRGVAALPEVPDATHSAVLGYTVADYLLHTLSRQRRTRTPSDTTWDALVTHTTSPSDRARLVHSAWARQEHHHARVLFEGLAAAGDRLAALDLASVLDEQGLVDEAITVLTKWSGGAASGLADLLAKHDRVRELRERADAGDHHSSHRLSLLLQERGQEKELRERAEAGDTAATEKLAWMLAEQGRADDAMAVLAARIDAGDVNAPYFMAELLAHSGRVEEGINVLRTQVAAVADRFPFGSRFSGRFVDFLHAHGRVQELREWADADRWYTYPAERLADLLANQGLVEELRERADAGDKFAIQRLTDLMFERGQDPDRESELRAEADAGNWASAYKLTKLLYDQGRVQELRDRANAGEWLSASRLADLLAERGEVTELCERADAGDWESADRLAYFLAIHGRIDDLRKEFAAGNRAAAFWLRQLGYDP